MKVELDLFRKKYVEVDVTYSHEFSGYGHRKVTGHLTYKGQTKRINHTSTDMQFFDDLEDGVDKDPIFHEKFFDEMEEIAREWVCDIEDL